MNCYPLEKIISIANNVDIKIIFSDIDINIDDKKRILNDIGVYLLNTDLGRYIGSSKNINNRISTHNIKKKVKQVKTVDIFLTKDINSAIILEKALIYNLNPELNWAGLGLDHCCAICKDRPIDFLNSNKRNNPEQLWRYKKGLTDEQIVFDYIEKGREEEIKIYRKCRVSRWTKMAPFKRNRHECFRLI